MQRHEARKIGHSFHTKHAHLLGHGSVCRRVLYRVNTCHGRNSVTKLRERMTPLPGFPYHPIPSDAAVSCSPSYPIVDSPTRRLEVLLRHLADGCVNSHTDDLPGVCACDCTTSSDGLPRSDICTVYRWSRPRLIILSGDGTQA